MEKTTKEVFAIDPGKTTGWGVVRDDTTVASGRTTCNGTAREAFIVLFIVALATAALILSASVLLTCCGGGDFSSGPAASGFAGGSGDGSSDATPAVCRLIQRTPGDFASQYCGQIDPVAYNCERDALPQTVGHCTNRAVLSQPEDPVPYYLWCCTR